MKMMQKKMVRIIITVLFASLLCLTLFSQNARKVPRITSEYHTWEWYSTQSDLWRQIIDQDPRNEVAWENYYEANRAAGLVGHGRRPVALEDIMTQMEKAIPGTATLHYLRYRNGGNNGGLLDDLRKAYTLNPAKPELWEEFVTYYELEYKPERRKEFNIKTYEANIVSEELIAFNYNVLMSLKPRAILFTNGDNDTYPAWLIQDALSVRRDVIVLNRSLAFNQDYLNRVLKANGIQPFTYSTTGEGAFQQYQDELVRHLVNHADRPVYFALTVGPDAIKTYRDKLYVVGMASEYSEKRFDNLKVLAKNVEDKFLLDHLKVNFRKLSPYSSIKFHRQAYLTPLLMLHRHYLDTGQTSRADDLRLLLEKIARDTDHVDAVQKALGN